ncbi:DUF3833 domain-containing protein [Gemmobacter aquarius]|uniref:DUF3833 domain-containing protein n=2 Tax=Paragemmobacter aquarius TaxID=2169400 RepID=A0A2S0UI41_9RHOB|nr:DUF3833 family protein [Gemmobacter aquarius]AWB47474.1 DUF3833 domain-containing protein [Gemmobacter aquarius]
MMRIWALGLVAGLVAALAGCTGKPSLQDKPMSGQDFALERFFDGRLVARGQFQDVFGTVRRSFVVQLVGDWDGERLRLVEDFTYEDGSTEQRIWTLQKVGPVTADQAWEGTAPGVIGIAKGQEKGDRFNWAYTIDLPVPQANGPAGVSRVSFDDWMWAQSEDRLFNRAYMKKYGLDVGDVSISFEKLD